MRLALIVGCTALPLLAGAQISVENFEPGEIVRHPLVVLKGRVKEGSVRVGTNAKNLVRFPAFQNRYCALAELKPGPNYVILAAGNTRVRIRLDYRPPKTPYRVEAFWVKASDEADGAVQPGIRPAGDYRHKLDVSMKLLQSFCAEAMRDAGYGRRTFALDTLPTGKVNVRVVVLPKTGNELRAMDGNAIWSLVYDTLSKERPPTSKWCAMMAFTGWDAATKKGLGHFALGGGQLAGFGGGTVGYWPSSIAEVPKVFADRAPIDPAQTFEDSAGRQTVWANVATAFGAMMHEQGHTFGLPHSADPFCVMSRGFDYFNRTFMPYEPPQRNQPDERPVLPNTQSRWDPFQAARLNVNPWLQPDGLKFVESDPPTVEVTGREVIFRSARGLRVVGADRDDVLAIFREVRGPNPPNELKLSMFDLRARFGDKPVRLTAIDTEGNQTSVEQVLPNELVDQGKNKEP